MNKDIWRTRVLVSDGGRSSVISDIVESDHEPHIGGDVRFSMLHSEQLTVDDREHLVEMLGLGKIYDETERVQ